MEKQRKRYRTEEKVAIAASGRVTDETDYFRSADNAPTYDMSFRHLNFKSPP